MGRTEAAIVVAAAAFLALVVVTFRAPAQRENLPRPAPEFRLPSLGGDSVSLGERRGHPVLVNFWATWCPPCVEETPALVALDRKLRSRGLEVLGVSMDEEEAPLRAFVDRYQLGYRVLRDPTAATAHRYGTYKYPETYLVDATGQIIRRWVGAVDWARTDVMKDIEDAILPAGVK